MVSLAALIPSIVAPRLITTVARRSPHMPAQEITLACAFTTSIMNTGISINGYISLTRYITRVMAAEKLYLRQHGLGAAPIHMDLTGLLF